jgi:hypothetical protein
MDDPMKSTQPIAKDGIHITVEFTGVAQLLAGESDIKLMLRPEMTYADIISILAGRYPDMVGVLIDSSARALLSSNLFIINNEMAEPAFFMNAVPHDGDRITLLSVATGG